jgi:hypothetical protein
MGKVLGLGWGVDAQERFERMITLVRNRQKPITETK